MSIAWQEAAAAHLEANWKNMALQAVTTYLLCRFHGSNRLADARNCRWACVQFLARLRDFYDLINGDVI